MRVLMIGNYADGTGWSRAGCDYVLALDEAGVDVVARPVKLNGRKEPVPARVAELMAKPAGGHFDAAIQHVLPHMMSYDARLGKNIGLFASETSNFRRMGWADNLNLMDEVWAINHQQVDACRESGVVRPIKVVPHACNPADYEGPFPLFPGLSPHFKFYTIGEAVPRKNLRDLLRAYFGEFHGDEPVCLVIKADCPGLPPQEGGNRLSAYVADVAKQMKVVRHPPVHIISARLSEPQVMALHASCDVFVQASYGEAWSLTGFAAMAMGKTPVVPASTGYREYMDESAGYLVDVREEPAYGALDTFDGLHTHHEKWWAVDVLDMKRQMRVAYQDRGRGEKAAHGRRRANMFSHQRVGALMRGLLEGAQDESATRREGLAGTQGP